MQLVPIAQIKEDRTYLLPWRPPGLRAGKVLRQGLGSVVVHQPKHEGDGWERTAIAKSTRVIACHDDFEYASQGFGQNRAGGRVKNKSTVRKPVEVVWELCDEIIGRGRVATTVERDEVVASAVEQGVNKNTAQTQYYAWRKMYAASR